MDTKITVYQIFTKINGTEIIFLYDEADEFNSHISYLESEGIDYSYSVEEYEFSFIDRLVSFVKNKLSKSKAN